MASYNELISSYIRRQGGDDTLVAAVVYYLDNAHPHDEPRWDIEVDDVVRAAIGYANSKAERLRKHKKRIAAAKAKRPAPTLNARHRQSLAQEAHALRFALSRHCSNPRRRQSLIARLERLEKLIKEQAK
jgi:hypothetical protein